MLNEVINTIHQLAAACNEYKGIVFTDKDGNIINDKNNDTVDNIEITAVDHHEETKPHIHIMMTQMNMGDAMQKFGDKDSEALLKD